MIIINNKIRKKMSHSNIIHLTKLLSDASKKVKICRSHKKHYNVLNIGLQENTEKPCVIFQSIAHPELIWAKDVDIWCEDKMHDVKISHPNITHLTKLLSDASKKVKIGGSYYHYKSHKNLYNVLNIGLQENTEKPCVIYQSIANSTIPELIWIRDVDVWCEDVLYEGKNVRRFNLVD